MEHRSSVRPGLCEPQGIKEPTGGEPAPGRAESRGSESKQTSSSTY